MVEDGSGDGQDGTDGLARDRPAPGRGVGAYPGVTTQGAAGRAARHRYKKNCWPPGNRWRAYPEFHSWIFTRL